MKTETPETRITTACTGEQYMKMKAVSYSKASTECSVCSVCALRLPKQSGRTAMQPFSLELQQHQSVAPSMYEQPGRVCLHVCVCVCGLTLCKAALLARSYHTVLFRSAELPTTQPFSTAAVSSQNCACTGVLACTLLLLLFLSLSYYTKAHTHTHHFVCCEDTTAVAAAAAAAAAL
jgi:hypothetical protein